MGIGAAGEKVGLPLEGRIADLRNAPPGRDDEDWDRRLGIVRDAAEGAGRDPSTIEVSGLRGSAQREGAPTS